MRCAIPVKLGKNGVPFKIGEACKQEVAIPVKGAAGNPINTAAHGTKARAAKL